MTKLTYRPLVTRLSTALFAASPSDLDTILQWRLKRDSELITVRKATLDVCRRYQRVQFTNAAITQAARRRPGLDVVDGGPRFGHLTAWDAEQIRRAELGQRGPLNPAQVQMKADESQY